MPGSGDANTRAWNEASDSNDDRAAAGMKHDVDGGIHLRTQNNRASRPSVFERFVGVGRIGQCVGLRTRLGPLLDPEETSGMEARSRWLSIINEKTLADFKRVAEQTGILTREPDHPPQEC
jgi:hypothetical protein